MTAEAGSVAGRLREGQLCRPICQDNGGTELLMEHAMSQGQGLLVVSIRPLPSS